MKKLIAYRTIDREGDVWSEDVFLFEDYEQAVKFFNKDNPKLREIYEDNVLKNFKIHDDNPAKRISAITFNCDYAGDVEIREMSTGYLITS